MGEIDLNPPATNLRSQDAAPDWAGSLKNLYDFPTGTFGAVQPLIPNRNDLPAAPHPGRMGGGPRIDHRRGDPLGVSLPDRRRDIREHGLSVAAGLRTINITGLTNGQRYDVQFRAVREDSGNSAANTLQARPVAAAVAPPAPALTLVKAAPTTLQMRSVISGNVSSNAPIQKHQYRIGTTSQGVQSATWVDIPNSASKDVTFTITGRSQNTIYYVQTRAVNSVGNGTRSSTRQARTAGNAGTGNTFGSWIKQTTSQPDIVPQQADPDNATDGLFRLTSDWRRARRGESSASWWMYLQWTDGNTQHQVRALAYSSRNHRSRTRTSQQADWGAWSAWGSADTYRVADLNAFNATAAAPVGLFSPAGQSAPFTKSANAPRLTAASYFQQSIWFVYNEITGTGANQVTRQVAVKFYRDTGANDSFLYKRTANYQTTPITVAATGKSAGGIG